MKKNYAWAVIEVGGGQVTAVKMFTTQDKAKNHMACEVLADVGRTEKEKQDIVRESVARGWYSEGDWIVNIVGPCLINS